MSDARLVLKTDRFGNPITGELPYAKGQILRSSEDDSRKIAKAHHIIRERIKQRLGVFNFSGLERAYPAGTDDISHLDDETASAQYAEELKEAGLGHLGGSEAAHDVFLTNRLTAATVATHLALVKPGQTVIGISPSYTHPTVIRAVNLSGGRFVGTTGAEEFSNAVRSERNVSLVVMTRLAVTYDILDIRHIHSALAEAKARSLPVYLDDAGGARVGPAIFGQPKSLELGVDVAATGLDKYGVYGPRFGLLGGRRELVSRIRSKAWELGLEARPIFFAAAVKTLQRYDPNRVKILVETTKQVGEELKKLLGSTVHETPVVSVLQGEDVLQMVMDRSGRKNPPFVPYEATAALAMALLQDYGIITVHFAGVPPGTSALLFKFIPPETLERFGGARKFAEAVDASITKVARIPGQHDGMQRLLFDAESRARARFKST